MFKWGVIDTYHYISFRCTTKMILFMCISKCSLEEVPLTSISICSYSFSLVVRTFRQLSNRQNSIITYGDVQLGDHRWNCGRILPYRRSFWIYMCVYVCVCVCVCIYIFKQQSLSSNEISGEFRYRTDKLLDRLQRVGGPPPLKAPGPPGTKAQLEN